MLSPVAATLLAVTLISAMPLAVALPLPRDDAALRRVVRWLVAFATGALLGTSFLHLIPEAFMGEPGLLPSLLVLAGFFSFFVLERHLWVHMHEGTTSRANERALHPLAALNLLGDAVHNAVDGMAIAAAFLVEPALGVSTSLAVLLHEVPQEMGDYGILLHAGLTRRRAIAWNLVSGVIALLSAVLVLIFGAHFAGLAEGLVPFAAGGFIYIAAADLLPRLREEAHLRQTGRLMLTVLLGSALTALPLLLEHE